MAHNNDKSGCWSYATEHDDLLGDGIQSERTAMEAAQEWATRTGRTCYVSDPDGEVYEVQPAVEAHPCECAQADGGGGSPCEEAGDLADMVVLDVLPEHLRSPGGGRYPLNGALRLLVSRRCSRRLMQHDWAEAARCSPEQLVRGR